MRWLIASSVAIVTLAPLAAQAADLPPAVPPYYPAPAAIRTVANWSGFYLGGNVGVLIAEISAHLVKMYSEGPFRRLVSKSLNPTERRATFLADSLEQRQGDQPRVDQDVRE